jgi:hypothetical protein
MHQLMLYEMLCCSLLLAPPCLTMSFQVIELLSPKPEIYPVAKSFQMQFTVPFFKVCRLVE